MATNLRDLIENVNADDLPTNEFTIEDKDPMVILGKMNEIIAYLETLAETIESSDTKATQALANSLEALTQASEALETAQGIDGKATQAMEDALTAISTANTALSNAGIALSTANTALSSANTAVSTANSAETKANTAISTANSADSKADTAISTANGAKATAEGIDAKATQALSNSQTAITTAEEAKDIAEEALEQVITQAGTKVYVGGVLQSTFNADTKADLTRVQTLESDVGTLETNVETIQEDITNIENDITGLNTDINNLYFKNQQQDTEISALDTRISSQATQIAGAISVNNTQNSRLDTDEAMIGDISDELETQQTSINNLSTTLGNHTTQLINLTNEVSVRAKTDASNINVASYQSKLLAQDTLLFETTSHSTGNKALLDSLANYKGISILVAQNNEYFTNYVPITFFRTTNKSMYINIYTWGSSSFLQIYFVDNNTINVKNVASSVTSFKVYGIK